MTGVFRNAYQISDIVFRLWMNTLYWLEMLTSSLDQYV